MTEDMKTILDAIGEVKHDINKLDGRVQKIELSLENEIIPGIKVVAEGHDFLIHKFDEAVRETYRSREVNELFQLRLNAVETDISQLKRQVKALA